MPIIRKHHVHPYSNAILFHSDDRRARWDADHALPLPRTGNRLVDQHLPHACFRRTSPQRFWFRGLWRKPGQRFAVCGGNPAFKQDAAVALQKRARQLMSQKETLLSSAAAACATRAQQPKRSAASLSYRSGRKGAATQRFRRGSGPPEKVFNELWKPSRGRLGARRGCKLLDDHKAVDLSLQVGV